MLRRTLRQRRAIIDERRADPDTARRRRAARLAELVAHARAGSPYYHRLYRDLPDRIDDPTVLPVTDKRRLMAHFDDWATDRAITRDGIRAFIADPGLVGRRFLGRYTVVTTSGTTGQPGVFVADDAALGVNFALNSLAMRSWLSARDLAGVARRGGRTAFVLATDGHFLANVGATRMRDSRFGGRVRIMSVHSPLSELVAELNAFRPAVLLGYGSVLRRLAGEQLAGRLDIDPVLVQPAGEGMSPAVTRRMSEIFDARVRDVYGCGECPFLTVDCPHGWYHVNDDWALVEAVDANHRPVPDGEASHTVLISNLANRLQPILRYDLGDSVTVRPDPCPCGDRRPALRVRGRMTTVLTMSTADDEPVELTSMQLATCVNHVEGVDQCQLVHTAPNRIAVRVRAFAGAQDATVWHGVRRELTALLTAHRLGNVSVVRDPTPPRLTTGGKYRAVVPLSESSD